MNYELKCVDNEAIADKTYAVIVAKAVIANKKSAVIEKKAASTHKTYVVIVRKASSVHKTKQQAFLGDCFVPRNDDPWNNYEL
jgi:hypothetical protein